MDIVEARELQKKYTKLVGTTYKNQEISAIIIVPAENLSVASVVQSLLSAGTFSISPQTQKNVNLIVLFDLDEFPQTGQVYWKYLSDFLKELP
jgi:hypothetical protein